MDALTRAMTDYPFHVRELVLLALAYACGCFATGYYLVRWRTGRDLRAIGSGNVGAKNVGRVLGRKDYVLTAVVDVFKGWTAVLLAKFFGLDAWWLAAAAIAVVIGHNWPVQLGFRGGKGVATTYGAILALDPLTAVLMWVAFIPLLAVKRNTTLPGLLAFATAPAIAWGLDDPTWTVVLFVLLAGLLWLTHWKNLWDAWQQWSLRHRAARPPH